MPSSWNDPIQTAERLSEKRLSRFLAQHAYYGRRAATDLLSRLRSAAAPCRGDAEAEVSGGWSAPSSPC